MSEQILVKLIYKYKLTVFTKSDDTSNRGKTMDEPTMNPKRYRQLIGEYQKTQLLFAAIKLDIFTYMDKPMTVEDVAKNTGFDIKKVKPVLLALVSAGFVTKVDNKYRNTDESSKFLSQNSDDFIGEFMLFREAMTSLNSLEKNVRNDTTEPESKVPYNFVNMTKKSVPDMYFGRIRALVDLVQTQFTNHNQPLNVLDIGGGTGIISSEIMKVYPNGSAVVFDDPKVLEVTEVKLAERKAERVKLCPGDFNKDEFSGKYDLVIASGVFSFVTIPMRDFLEKIKDCMNPGGRLVIVELPPEENQDVPANMVNWLSGHLRGLPLPLSRKELLNLLFVTGFQYSDSVDDGFFLTTAFRLENMNSSMQDMITNSFIELTEAMYNSNSNMIDFGQEGMKFRRGDIHLLKVIGDEPGVFNAELARRFDMSKTLMHNNLKKLQEKGLITTRADDNDAKINRLYLTEKGKLAYDLHEQYHIRHDKAIFDYISTMPVESLKVINDFLRHAIDLINNQK